MQVQKVIQVAWEEDDPSKGIAYMYLTEQDYTAVGKGVKAQLTTTPEGEKRWVLQDIIGNEDGLGVENLSGSAAIGTLYCRWVHWMVLAGACCSLFSSNALCKVD